MGITAINCNYKHTPQLIDVWQMMNTKKIFHLIVIPDQDLGEKIASNLYMQLNGDGQQSKYFGFLASVFCSHLVYKTTFQLIFLLHHTTVGNHSPVQSLQVQAKYLAFTTSFLYTILTVNLQKTYVTH